MTMPLQYRSNPQYTTVGRRLLTAHFPVRCPVVKGLAARHPGGAKTLPLPATTAALQDPLPSPTPSYPATGMLTFSLARAISGGIRSCNDSRPSPPKMPLLLPPFPRLANSRPFLPGTQGADALLVLLLVVEAWGCDCVGGLFISQGVMGVGL